ncbi:hypothetical protein J7384_19215, partial [Endozoicomonas sp. G2_1]|uniref:hypothetical protein n=1 Tax=Endozoicomonas sp. G2_1 TaxID=2821091 RepID=UPI001ADA5FB8
ALGFMKKALISFGLLLIVYLNVNAIVGLLPDSDFKLNLRLLINKAKLEKLIKLAESSEYTHILWVKNEIQRAGVRENDSVNWGDSSDLTLFVSLAEQFNFNSIELIKGKGGNWLFGGYTKVLPLNEPETKIKNIDTDYLYGQTPEFENCDDIKIKNLSEGKCYIALYDKWFLYKYWFTYNLN